MGATDRSLQSAPDDPWWDEVHHVRDVAAVPSMSMVAGWYDLFVSAQLDDFRRLRAVGRRVRLTAGPWTHSSLGNGASVVRDVFEWMDAEPKKTPSTWSCADKARVFVMGRAAGWNWVIGRRLL
ncbi:CocE/NonD family hydrolase [Amycolatopsis sp. cmx-11-12]|uniref:CocE/NonD family hydrolase n=1 Tax=Amycolatopsis sp. cmx-11-12 TaxID=2785795 RepID=UPI003917E67C